MRAAAGEDASVEEVAAMAGLFQWLLAELAGDVAFFDNRLTQHYACADYLPERRIMHRATILDGRVPHSLLLEIFTAEGLGTMVVKSDETDVR